MGNLRFRQVHLDFHTSEKIVSVGEEFNAKDFAATLAVAGVNSITCFARCHHGMLYYDTKYPNKHPGLKRNLLKEQIDACHAAGIKVPIYITVGWDEFIAMNHPEWIERTPEGKPYGAGPFEAGWKTLCFNTPYIDYVEDQTVEVLEKFGKDVDGIFFDIIFQDPCCCNYCVEDMLKLGMNPKSEADRKQFASEVLNKFKNRLTTAIRKHNSECTIFYNAGHVNPEIRNSIDTYTHLELESLPSGGWGYDHFPITVKYAKLLGLEYLSMTGKFHKSWADFGGFKNQPALEYECFLSIANGAKISIGDQLHPNGAINKATYELIGSVYNQVKLKEEWCDDVKPVSEIAVYSTEAVNSGHARLDPSLRGIFHMLNEARYQFDIVDSENDFAPYKVIILPDCIPLSEKLKDKLDVFINNGGNIMLSYKSGMNEAGDCFALKDIGIEYIGEAEFSPDYVTAGDSLKKGLKNTEYVMYDKGTYVKALGGTEILADIWNPYFNRSYEHFCSHFQTPVEKKSEYPAATKKNGIIYFAHPVFSMYYKHGYRPYKQLVLNALELILKEKLIVVNAPSTLHVYFNEQPEKKRFIAHILHYIPERRSEAIDTIEDIIPIYNIDMMVKLAKKPEKVYLAPSMKKLDFMYESGYVKITVPEVVGHEMVVFE